MAKPRVTKKKVKNSFNKKHITYGILAVLVLGFLMSFVSVPVSNSVSPVTGNVVGNSQFANFFTNWGEGNFDVTLMKYFFWAIVCILINNILSSVKILSKNSFFNFILALVISFISVAFITPSEVYTILTSYSALGLTLSMALPFLLLFWGSDIILKGKAKASKSLTVLLLWVVFLIFEIYKMITFFIDFNTGQAEFNWPVAIVMIFVTLVTTLIVMFNKKFRKSIRKLQNEALIDEQRRAAIRAGAAAGSQEAQRQAQEEIAGNRVSNEE